MATLPSVGEENYPTPDEILALVLGSIASFLSAIALLVTVVSLMAA